MSDYREEININLKDLLLRLLKKWKQIAACALACAVLAGAYSAYKENGKRSATYAFMQNHPGLTYAAADKAKALVSSSDPDGSTSMENVKNAIERINAYQLQIDDTQSYLADSVICSLNTGKVPTSTAMYMIGIKNESAQNATSAAAAGDVILAYRSYVLSDEVLHKIIDNAGLKTECRYLREAITVGRDSSLDSEKQVQDSNMMVVTVYWDSPETCSVIASELSSAMEKATPAIKKSLDGCDFSLSLVNSKMEEADAGWIRDIINDKYKTITDLTTNIDNVTKNMSDGEKALLNELMLENKLTEDGNAAQLAKLDGPSGSLLNKKMIAVGFIAGAFIACAWYCCRYIFSGRLRVADDLRDVFGLYDLETPENAKAIAAKKGYENICVLGAAKDETELAGVEIADADAAVLAEKLDVSQYSAIAREVETCRQYDVPVLGYIVYKS